MQIKSSKNSKKYPSFLAANISKRKTCVCSEKGWIFFSFDLEKLFRILGRIKFFMSHKTVICFAIWTSFWSALFHIIGSVRVKIIFHGNPTGAVRRILPDILTGRRQRGRTCLHIICRYHPGNDLWSWTDLLF